MSFNFLPQNRLEKLTCKEVNNLIKEKKAEYFFDTRLQNIFLNYLNKIYLLKQNNGNGKYFERIHGKEYLKILKEAREGR